MFADAFRRRRAIVPADTYNLRAAKGDLGARLVVSRADGTPIAWAELWESYVWPGGRIERTYCVITVDANGLVAPWHDRMPLVLEPESWDLWLGDIEGDPAALLWPAADDVLMLRPIGKKAPARR